MQRLLLLGLTTLAGCTSMLQPGRSDDTSSAFEPPRSWVAGINFQFADSTFVWPMADYPPPTVRYGADVEFFDGRRHRKVRGQDVFTTDANELRTPWYRIWMPSGGERPVTVRITIGDPQGERTVAEYPLNVRSDGFYQIRFGVGTNDRRPGWVPNDVRGYAVPPGARISASDSLWVGWVGRGRDCFDCPT